ncbi:uncharacterized protein LOC143231724 isoform X2 [Tachypleus tridentatus]|uniref:uncharacterized protein LOC143231724 isoform X2 n=1 Tax=Tachypleus tridentatus TaxID=6853 RepID=UPI003FD43A9F
MKSACSLQLIVEIGYLDIKGTSNESHTCSLYSHCELNGDCCKLSNRTRTTSSWRSSSTPEDKPLTLSPWSCFASSDPDGNTNYTIGTTESTLYGSQFCNEAFERLGFLKQPEQAHSDQMPFKCDYCQRLFKHKRSRDRHIKLHTGDKRYRCQHCESAFSRSDHLKIHMKTHDHAKPFQCTLCNRGYNTAAALTSHMQNHKKTRESTSASTVLPIFHCFLCSGSFSTSKKLQKHVETCHKISSSPNETSHRCVLCGSVSFSASALHEHMKQRHRLDVQSNCSICRKTFISPDELASHRKIHEDEDSSHLERRSGINLKVPKLECGFCSKTNFSCFEALQLHVQAIHVPSSSNFAPFLNISPVSYIGRYEPQDYKEKFGCEYCNTKFSSMYKLIGHRMTAHGINGFGFFAQEKVFCTQCTMGFSSVSQLTDHVNTKHKVLTFQQNIYPGDPDNNASGESKSSNHSLEPTDEPLYNRDSHQNSSAMYKKHKANTSHNSRPTDDLLHKDISHLNSSTSILYNTAFLDFETLKTRLKYQLNIAARTYKCSKCEVQFNAEYQLTNHMIGHFLTASIKHGCQYCLKLFSKPDELQKHLLDIHAVHFYWCSLCEEVFDSKVNIQVHFAMKHSRENTVLKCTSCNAVFCSELDFQVHVKVAHLLRFRPFCCLLCNQSFPTEESLRHHLSTHKKQYPCKVCTETFHEEYLLDKHVQSHHSIDSLTSSKIARDQMSSSRSSDLIANDRTTISGSDHNQLMDEISSFAPSRSSNETTSNTEDQRRFCCDICNEIFCFKSQLSGRHFQNFAAGSKKVKPVTVSLLCTRCRKRFKSHSELETRVRIHAATPPIRSCDEKFASVDKLSKHKLTHCKAIKGHACTTCNINVHNEEEFMKHLKFHNDHSLPVSCIVCQQTLESEEEIKLHIDFHLSPADLRHSCCVCSREYVVHELIITARRGNGHIYMCKQCFHAKGENLRPSECQVTCETTATLEKHTRRFRCVKCQSETEAEVQVDVSTHLVQERTQHECKLCYQVLDSTSKLQCHLIKHSFDGSAQYTCYTCKTVFTSANDIQQHVLQHGPGSRIHHCSNCHQKLIIMFPF